MTTYIALTFSPFKENNIIIYVYTFYNTYSSFERSSSPSHICVVLIVLFESLYIYVTTADQNKLCCSVRRRATVFRDGVVMVEELIVVVAERDDGLPESDEVGRTRRMMWRNQEE